MNLDKGNFSSHFDLSNTAAYCTWRDEKLSNYPALPENLLVSIEDFTLLSELEEKQIHQNLLKYNMVIYSLNKPKPVSALELCQFAKQFGLAKIDGNICSGEQNVSTVTVRQEGRNKAYIPYTNKPISWHTDGYYNSLDKTVRGFVLHCLQSASNGGENNLLDPEILYILLRDENPDFIVALMQDDVLTIPENIEDGIKIRDQQSGPVFSIDNLSNKLHLRYTARTRSIVWKESELVQQAVLMIQNILSTKTEYCFSYKLKAGQGLLCNNVLHNRTAFEDDSSTKRELLRARYYDRIRHNKF